MKIYFLWALSPLRPEETYFIKIAFVRPYSVAALKGTELAPPLPLWAMD